eukprot:UN08775
MRWESPVIKAEHETHNLLQSEHETHSIQTLTITIKQYYRYN